VTDVPNSERVTLAPGIDVLIRPIRPEDRHLLDTAFTRLTPQSRYQRFFAPVERLTESDLTYLTEIDHSRHEALVAIDPEDGELVGVARYVCLPPTEDDGDRSGSEAEGSGQADEFREAEGSGDGDEHESGSAESEPVPDEAEVAVVVGEPWQGKGLATALLQRLAKRAAEEGVDHFVALVLEENDDATSLFTNLVENGTEVADGDPGTVEILIELPGPGAFSESILARALGGYAKGTLRVSPWRRLQRRLTDRRRRKD
jgi:RimJ/RimL family protein N-acetyltransferase